MALHDLIMIYQLPIFIIIGTLTYIIYQYFVHPLARFPGPPLSALSPLWKTYYTYRENIHEKLLEAHSRYGPVIRIGPNDLHFWNAEAIAPIYKAGRSMPKTEFYEAFTAFLPNLFGGRNEDIHALRRRQMSHGFSQASIHSMEGIIDEQMEILLDELRRLAHSHQTFDLAQIILRYVFDIVGEMAFCRSFHSQRGENDKMLQAVHDHNFLGGVMGQLPMQQTLKLLVPWLPIPWLKRLIRSRNDLKKVCSESVKHKLNSTTGRNDLLEALVQARDPETKAALTEQEINSEAWALLVAGAHSTAATMSFFFWHVLHDHEALARMRDELDAQRPDGSEIFPIKGLEQHLPYTMLCIWENFRLSPVFSMLLWRKVCKPDGIMIGDIHVPDQTNVSISNYVLHHNPQIWGPDHAHFKPDRFGTEEGKESMRHLLPFSTGHRACIGRNLAMTNLVKTTASVLAAFDIQPLQQDPAMRLLSSGVGGMEGPFLCKVSVRDKLDPGV